MRLTNEAFVFFQVKEGYTSFFSKLYFHKITALFLIFSLPFCPPWLACLYWHTCGDWCYSHVCCNIGRPLRLVLILTYVVWRVEGKGKGRGKGWTGAAACVIAAVR